MGREVRRVPLDFDWPLNKVWEGFLQPDRLLGAPCPDCRRGYTWAREWIETLTNRIDMLASDIGDQDRGRPMHPWLTRDQYPATTDYRYDEQGNRTASSEVMRPSRDILELIAGLTGDDEGRLLSPLRGSSYGIQKKLIEAAGLDPNMWGVCATCKGHASLEKYKGQRAESEAWQPTDPPEGEGWQLWETVSEGSPISPAFAAADGLVEWMSDPARGDRWVPAETAAKFVAEGWAPSFVSTPQTGLASGVEYTGWVEEEK